jgi:DNA-binding NtrC family response regulator
LIQNRPALIAALQMLLSDMCGRKSGIRSLRASFDTVHRGLDADRSVLFVVGCGSTSVQLGTVCSRGFSAQQLSAVERGEIAAGTGLAEVWRKIEKSDRSTAPRYSTASSPASGLPETPFGFRLCLAIKNEIVNQICAVLYLERVGDGRADFNEAERMWAQSYAAIAGYSFAASSAELNQELSSQDTQRSRGLRNDPRIVGESLHTQALRGELEDIYIPACGKRDPEPILITGAKGTGKDLIARYIHAYSQRQAHPFIAVNCAEITDELATAKFFGHKKGAFTGSVANEPGLFRAADQGVLFLDEIGELSLRAQATLLRVLENRTVVPIGETREVRVNVQVVLATNCDLGKAVANGTLRADFYDRFRTMTIRLTPICERPFDIPPLVKHFTSYHEMRTDKKTLGFDMDAMRIMARYPWPGNVRELARVCSLLVTRVLPGRAIDAPLLDACVPYLRNSRQNPMAEAFLTKNVTLRDAAKFFERELIYHRLLEHNWNYPSARHSLGLPKTTFHRYLRKLSINTSAGVRTFDRGSWADAGFPHPVINERPAFDDRMAAFGPPEPVEGHAGFGVDEERNLTSVAVAPS